MLDFYSLRHQLKQAIVNRLEALNPPEHPFDWAWLAYALVTEGVHNNPLLDMAIERLSRWAGSTDAWHYDRNLGSIAMCSFLLHQMGRPPDDQIKNLLVKRLESLRGKAAESKFSLFNNPEQVFMLAFSLKSMLPPNPLNDIATASRQASTSPNPRRRLLFLAALLELEQEVAPLHLPSVEHPEDVATAIWFVERYGGQHGLATAKPTLWSSFERLLPTIILDPRQSDPSVELVILSNMSLALLYEGVVSETMSPNPGMLFDVYPLHQRVRQISETLFKGGEYLNAVLEAAKALNEYVQSRTGLQQSDRALMQEAFGGTDPKLRFNELRTRSQRNEQEGLKLIAEGVFTAYRNPKGHEPKDSPQVVVGPYEALDQLATISLLFRRVEEAAP